MLEIVAIVKISMFVTSNCSFGDKNDKLLSVAAFSKGISQSFFSFKFDLRYE